MCSGIVKLVCDNKTIQTLRYNDRQHRAMIFKAWLQLPKLSLYITYFKVIPDEIEIEKVYKKKFSENVANYYGKEYGGTVIGR